MSLTLAIIVELTADSEAITGDEFEKLGASGDFGCFTPPGPFPVSDLVAGNLPVLAAKGWGLPPKHDALRMEETNLHLAHVGPSVFGRAAVEVTSWFSRQHHTFPHTLAEALVLTFLCRFTVLFTRNSLTFPSLPSDTKKAKNRLLRTGGSVQIDAFSKK